MKTSKFQRVVEILIQQGLSDEQITNFCEAVTREGIAHLTESASESFTKDDTAKIDACATQEEVNELLKKLFKERTGKDPEEEMQRYIDTFANGFLEKHNQMQAAEHHKK